MPSYSESISINDQAAENNQQLETGSKRSTRISLGPPSINYILALRREVETTFRDDDLQIDLMRSIRALTRQVQIDEAYRLTDIEVRDPTITVEMQRVAAALSLND